MTNTKATGLALLVAFAALTMTSLALAAAATDFETGLFVNKGLSKIAVLLIIPASACQFIGMFLFSSPNPAPKQ